MTALKNDGSLLVICEIEYSSPKPKISVEQEVKAEPLDEKNEVDDKTLKAHRCILGQDSEVFRSMFAKKSMLEAQERIIAIKDSKFEPVRAMIDYMYTDSTYLVEDYAKDILVIADKYAVLPLKELCERYLSTDINRGNACAKVYHRDVLSSANRKVMKEERLKLISDLLKSIFFGGVLSDLNGLNFSPSDKTDPTYWLKERFGWLRLNEQTTDNEDE
ncbi:BTB/POZ domain-containing protein [Loa loa]|uniref:BTB/POZ domain-containing protein n=1 Tax=Loa loa TaxID=7209 RepID=A0A1I7V620_LOALO|nr:BTB/POZ domain-containing protein [Loa loa]EFO14439.1 BTB/POZ domain-containing protein [Loa loa]